MVLGHCFLRERTQCGHRLGIAPTTQQCSVVLGIEYPFLSELYTTTVAAPPVPVLTSHFLRWLFLEEVPGFPCQTHSFLEYPFGAAPCPVHFYGASVMGPVGIQKQGGPLPLFHMTTGKKEELREGCGALGDRLPITFVTQTLVLWRKSYPSFRLLKHNGLEGCGQRKVPPLLLLLGDLEQVASTRNP